MLRIKECLDRAGSYAAQLGVDSLGLGTIKIEGFKQQIAERSGLQKVVPIISNAPRTLLFVAMEFMIPSVSRGLSAATRTPEFNSVAGTQEYLNFYRDSVVAFGGILADGVSIMGLGAALFNGHPEALALKLMYNCTMHMTLDAISVPRLRDSLNSHQNLTAILNQSSGVK